MKPVARIVTRDSDNPNDGLIIGVRFDRDTLEERPVSSEDKKNEQT